jgi:hypothetical protein
MKKNLILGILDNYSFHQIKKFFLSLRQTAFTGDIYVFAGANTTPHTIRLLKKHGANVIQFAGLSSLPANNLAGAAFHFPQPINYFNFRHYLYYDFLQKHQANYQYVLLTDIRDVYFQEDPFAFKQEEGLYCAVEGKTKAIKDCNYNGPWMEFIYGKEVLNEIGNEIISCAGTTWGTTAAILDYLTKMLTEIAKLPDAKKAIDQAIHNYMIYKKMLPGVKFLTNDDGVILTLSYEHSYTIGADDKVRASNGEVVNTLHQFDRMPDLKKLTDKLYTKGKYIDKFLHYYYRMELSLHKLFLKAGLRKGTYTEK